MVGSFSFSCTKKLKNGFDGIEVGNAAVCRLGLGLFTDTVYQIVVLFLKVWKNYALMSGFWMFLRKNADQVVRSPH